jgi:UDP-N-acetylglucosamine--N-acetylmuramyl-(pentapeptide) pyrophosphoryl-undecaprenol N-acetylglucosamine transferase
MTAKQPILITAGGTGGHVYPGLAVARDLQAQGIPVIWMGTPQGLESKIIPPTGIEIALLNVSGLRGKGLKPLLLAPVKLTKACWQAFQIMRKHKPAAVLGMGGFVAGPGGFIAAVMGIPVIIHEQNSVAGLTNKLLARFSKRVLAGFPSAFKASTKVEVVGNPVRRDIGALPDPSVRIEKRRHEPLKLLVIGGSLGAQALNQTVPKAVALMPMDQRPDIQHQAGAKNSAEAEKNYQEAQVQGKVLPFIEDMAKAYEWADVVICRAGALTVAELASAGVAAILVPYPHAVDDHQTGNAKYLSDAGAALLMPQSTLTAEQLAEKLTYFSQHRDALIEMATRARALAKPHATAQVAAICAHYANYPFTLEGANQPCN